MTYKTNGSADSKFCRECGSRIARNAVVCPCCGCQVELLRSAAPTVPNIVINNANQNVNTATRVYDYDEGLRNKWVAFFLCLFFGVLGAHKFYEGCVGEGFIFMFTFGLLGIGWICNTIALLGKPRHYYVD